jgi:hypothetical protein
MMKLKILIPIFIVLITGISGCQSTETTVKKQNKEQTDETVKEVKIVEPPKGVTSPSNSVLKQYEVIFNNGKTKFLTKSSIISETTLGTKSIVSIKSPEGKNKYAVFLYEYDTQWYMDGLLRLGFYDHKAYTNTEGLALPFEKFNAHNIKLKDNKDIWAFVDKKTIVTIARFDRFSFTNDSSTKEIKLNNSNIAYLGKDPMNQQFLYFFDHEKIIVVSGNISEEKLINLANSLPPALSASFPSAQK